MFADELDTAEVIETELRIEFADEDDSDLETEEVLCPDCGYPVSSLDCNCSSKETD
jgi:hypothetical protein